MKKVFIPIIFLISLLLLYIVFDKENNNLLDMDKALSIGEEKYLEFLWMVDGAFNSKRENGDFIVNNKTLSDSKKLFTCNYKNKKSKECIGTNFEKEFHKLFLKTIKYDNVYSDGLLYKWYRYENGNYIFKYLDNCEINRMDYVHKLDLVNISYNKLKYQVSFLNKKTNKFEKRDFILRLENNEWKIENAFYYDLCGIKYYIY